MTTEEKNKVRKQFLKMASGIQDGEIHIVAISTESAEKDDEDESV